MKRILLAELLLLFAISAFAQKTTFVNEDPETGTYGTELTAEFLNTIFVTNGGHYHDGSSTDGHARKLTFINEISYAPAYFAGTEAGISSALTTIGSDTALVVVSREVTVTDSITFPDNVAVYLQGGGRFVGNDLTVLRLPKYFSADGYIFECDEDSIPDLSAVGLAKPTWFGASAESDTAVNAAAFRAAFSAGVNIEVDPGRYEIGSPIYGDSTLANRWIYGARNGVPTLIWKGDTTATAMVEITGADRVHVSDLAFEVDSTVTTANRVTGLLIDTSDEVYVERCDFVGWYNNTNRPASVIASEDMVSGDTLTVSIDGTDYVGGFNTSHDATMTALASALEADGFVTSATFDGDLTIDLVMTGTSSQAPSLTETLTGPGSATASVSGTVDIVSYDVGPYAMMSNGVYLRQCDRSLVRDCNFGTGIYTGVRFRSCNQTIVESSSFVECTRGVMMDDDAPTGSYLTISQCVAKNIRHQFTKLEDNIIAGTVDGCRITIDSTASTFGSASGVIITHSPHSLIRGNTVSQDSSTTSVQSAICVEGDGKYSTVEGNHVIGGDYASRVHDDYGEIADCAIRIATTVNEASGVLVSGNHIEQIAGTGRGIFVFPNSTTVRGNVIVGEDTLSCDGVYLHSQTTQSMVEDNFLTDCFRGVVVDDAGQYVIRGNIIIDAQAESIDLIGSCPVGRVQNNDILRGQKDTAVSENVGIHHDGYRFDSIAVPSDTLVSVDGGAKTGIAISNQFGDGAEIEISNCSDSNYDGVWELEDESTKNLIVIDTAYVAGTVDMDIQGIGLLYSLIVTDNKIRNVQHGIYLRNELGYHDYLYDVIVANNHILDVSFDGVQIYTADRVTVEGNVVRTANRKGKSFGRGFTMREINDLIFTGNMYSEDSGAPGGAESGVTFHTDSTYIAQNNIMLSLKEVDSYNGSLSANIVDGVQTPLRQQMIGEALADATSYYLPTGEAGWGFVQLGDNAAWASFSFTSAGVVTLIDNANANTDSTLGTLSVFDAGAGVGFKNHSGGSATLRALVHSSP